MQVALEALSLSDCVASSEQTGVEMASIGYYLEFRSWDSAAILME